MIENSVHHEVVTLPPSNRKFGLLFSAVFFALGLFPLIMVRHFTLWPWIASSLFLGAASFCPGFLGPFNRFWMKFGDVLHRIVSPVILGIMFFLMITPMGLLMRMFGKRLLAREFNPEIESYWVTREPSVSTPESMRNQF